MDQDPSSSPRIVMPKAVGGENIAPGEDSVVTSPATPGIFAISASYYIEIGGLDSALRSWGLEAVELSLR